MRQVLTIGAVAAVVLLVASPAGAGSAKGPTLKSLQAQIKSLQKQVKTLKKKEALNESVIGLTLEYAVCSTAVTADTFQDTFTGLDGYFAAQLAAGVLRRADRGERLQGLLGLRDRPGAQPEPAEHEHPAGAARHLQARSFAAHQRLWISRVSPATCSVSSVLPRMSLSVWSRSAATRSAACRSRVCASSTCESCAVRRRCRAG